MIAHNWDVLGHSIRTLLSFAPLIIASLLSGFALWRRATSVAWKEGPAIFQVLAVGASISLLETKGSTLDS